MVSPSGAVAIQDSNDQSLPAQPRRTATRMEYLIGAFLPTILAVLFSIPWSILFTTVKGMEPFYQLVDPRGAPARDSILLNYRASTNMVATSKGHFVVLSARLCSLVVLMLAPLASETVFIGFIGDSRCTATSFRDACYPQLSVYPVAARFVQGILGSVAVLTIYLVITISRRNSGVYANPLSVAGIATLFQNQPLIDEIRELDPEGFNPKALQAQLQGNRYCLGYFHHQDGPLDYGIIKNTNSSLCFDDTDTYTHYSHTNIPYKNKRYAALSVTPIEAETSRPRRPRPDYFLHPITVTAFAIFVIALLTLVIYYNHTGGNTAFERFMDSQTFGVTFMFTAVGVMLKRHWTVLDDHVRAAHPYCLLLSASSSTCPSARQSILASPPSNPFTGLIYSLRRKAWLPSLLSVVAVLTDPLIVALANIPFNPGTAYMAYQASTYVTIGVLSLMLLGLLGVLWQELVKGGLLRRGAGIARERSLGMMMGLICRSDMLSHFRDLAKTNEEIRDEMIMGWGKGYKMERVEGVDGVDRWAINEDVSLGSVREK